MSGVKICFLNTGDRIGSGVADHRIVCHSPPAPIPEGELRPGAGGRKPAALCRRCTAGGCTN
eukprot:551617-Rhodomonas_salina.1